MNSIRTNYHNKTYIDIDIPSTDSALKPKGGALSTFEKMNAILKRTISEKKVDNDTARKIKLIQDNHDLVFTNFNDKVNNLTGLKWLFSRIDMLFGRYGRIGATKQEHEQLQNLLLQLPQSTAAPTTRQNLSEKQDLEFFPAPQGTTISAKQSLSARQDLEVFSAHQPFLPPKEEEELQKPIPGKRFALRMQQEELYSATNAPPKTIEHQEVAIPNRRGEFTIHEEAVLPQERVSEQTTPSSITPSSSETSIVPEEIDSGIKDPLLESIKPYIEPVASTEIFNIFASMISSQHLTAAEPTYEEKSLIYQLTLSNPIDKPLSEASLLTLFGKKAVDNIKKITNISTLKISIPKNLTIAFSQGSSSLECTDGSIHGFSYSKITFPDEIRGASFTGIPLIGRISLTEIRCYDTFERVDATIKLPIPTGDFFTKKTIQLAQAALKSVCPGLEQPSIIGTPKQMIEFLKQTNET